jgi:hypothetical protein
MRHEDETPRPENFLLDNDVNSEWYCRDREPGMPDLPEYKQGNIHFKNRIPKRTRKRYDKDRAVGDERKLIRREVVERVQDKFGQPEYFDDGTPNPFWGKIDAKGPPAYLTDSQVAEFNKTPSIDLIMTAPWPAGTKDKWGQVPGDTGFGREDRTGLKGKVKGRIQGRDVKDFSYDNIPGEFLQDEHGNPMRLGNPDNDRNIFFGHRCTSYTYSWSKRDYGYYNIS